MPYCIDNVNQDDFQALVDKASYNTFLQSLAWQKFNQLNGHQTWLLGLYDNKQLLAVALILKITAKRGTFLFCPHGPVFAGFSQDLGADEVEQYIEVMQVFVDYLKKMALEENCSFIRFQPGVYKSSQSLYAYKKLGFIKAPIHMHTELSTHLRIDLDNSELLLKMRKTTRQMIKKGEALVAENKLQIEEFDSLNKELYEVYKSTYTRGKFVPYSQNYLQNEYLSFKQYAKVRLFGVRYQGQLISWSMVLVVGGNHKQVQLENQPSGRAFYHQGANILSKEVPNSYLTQWLGIQFAKQNGCISYDFWGVAPTDKPNHPWTSISMFKRGFGTTDTQLLEAQDLVINYKYWFNWLVEKIRAKQRGFVD